MRGIRAFILGSAVLAMLTACGKDDDKKSEEATASGSLEFENKTSAGLNLARPAVFQMKLIAAYVRFEASSNPKKPDSAMIYLNPDCKENIGTCDVSPGNHGAGGAAIENIVTTFFDFALPTEEVNAALNAQNREIVLYEPADDEDVPDDVSANITSAYLEFCKMITDDAINVKWGATESAVNELQLPGCVVASEQFNPPITIKKGDKVKFSLSYSLDESITVGEDATGDDCVGDGAEKTCFTMPKFIPSATK